METSKRNFLTRLPLALLVTATGCSSLPVRSLRQKPLVISTWGFGMAANKKALEVLAAGGGILDAVEKGIREVESDPGNTSVGFGGIPNGEGIVQLDACIMDGPSHKAGSVAAMEGIKHPISAARLVMAKTGHVMLVGEGARKFALQHNLETFPIKKADVIQNGKRLATLAENHDTVTVLVLGPDGNLAGGCSTSGWARKLPGRVGDSPIIGSGLYVDNDVGAAGATGKGENIMRHCGSFMVVEYMRQGMHPQKACEAVIQRIAAKERLGKELQINFIALDRQGRFGAAGVDDTFDYCVSSASEHQQRKATDALKK